MQYGSVNIETEWDGEGVGNYMLKLSFRELEGADTYMVYY